MKNEFLEALGGDELEPTRLDWLAGLVSEMAGVIRNSKHGEDATWVSTWETDDMDAMTTALLQAEECISLLRAAVAKSQEVEK